jgi:hypothetical protein
MKKRLPLVALSSLLALALSACGGYGGASSSLPNVLTNNAAVSSGATNVRTAQVSAGKVPVPAAGYAYLGALVNTSGCVGNCDTQTEADTESLESTIGKRFKIHNHYKQWTSITAANVSADPSISADATFGRYTMISWHCGATLASVISGSQDSVIEAAALALKGLNRPVILRYCWEFNGGAWHCSTAPCPNNFAPNLFNQTYTAQQKGQEFQDAWRHIYNIFKMEGANNVSFFWCPDGSPTQGKSRMIYSYPGAQYVDWKGFDAYDRWNLGFYNTVQKAYGIMLQLGDTLPIMIGETNESYSNPAPWTQQQYYKDAVTYIQNGTFPYIRAISLFIQNDTSTTGFNWLPNPGGLSQMSIWIHSPQFSV